MPNEEPQFDTLPPAIIDALRELDGPAVIPDTQRDADVLSGAHQHLSGVTQVDRKRRNLRLFFAGSVGGAIAAAAMVTFVVLVWNPAHNESPMADIAASTPDSPQPTAARQGDLDASGTIDILDAYALAKQVLPIKANSAVRQHDMNGDGSVDFRDVDWIANQAVALNTAERG